MFIANTLTSLFNRRPMSTHAPSSQHPVKSIGQQMKPSSAPGTSQTKPTDTVKLSPEALAQAVKPPATTPSTASSPSDSGDHCACASPATGMQQDRHDIQVDGRNTQHDAMDGDDDGGNDEEGNVGETENVDGRANEDGPKQAQDLHASTGEHNSQSDQQASQVDQRDDGPPPRELGQDVQEVIETQSALSQDLPSSALAGSVVWDLKSLLSDLEKV